MADGCDASSLLGRWLRWVIAARSVTAMGHSFSVGGCDGSSLLGRWLRWGVTAFEPTALLADRVQNISIYTVYIDMFCTCSAKSAVGSKAVTRDGSSLLGR